MDEEKSGQTNAGVEGAPPEPVRTPTPELDNEVDDRGVPLKNRVAELTRKLEDTQERIRRFEEERMNQTTVRPIADSTPQIPSVRKTREQVIEEINLDPEGWIDRKLQERESQKEIVRQQERMKDAEKLIYDKDPSNFRENVTRVVGIINKYRISTANPVDGIQAALEILKNEQKLKDLVSKSTTQQMNDEDKARIDSIKKTQTPTGATSKPQVTSDDSEVYKKRLIESGTEKDATNYFRNTLFNDDKKK
jgi:hypothetical protein